MTCRLAHTSIATAFAIGVLVGGAAMSVGPQGNRIPGNNGVNHVGINVNNMSEAIAYYASWR